MILLFGIARVFIHFSNLQASLYQVRKVLPLHPGQAEEASISLGPTKVGSFKRYSVNGF